MTDTKTASIFEQGSFSIVPDLAQQGVTMGQLRAGEVGVIADVKITGEVASNYRQTIRGDSRNVEVAAQGQFLRFSAPDIESLLAAIQVEQLYGHIRAADDIVAAMDQIANETIVSR